MRSKALHRSVERSRKMAPMPADGRARRALGRATPVYALNTLKRQRTDRKDRSVTTIEPSLSSGDNDADDGDSRGGVHRSGGGCSARSRRPNDNAGVHDDTSNDDR